MSMSNQNKEAKLKASIHDFVGPLLKRLKEEVPKDNDMGKIIEDIEKIKNHLNNRESWDRELAGFFGQIERKIDSWTDQKQVTIVGNKSNQPDILNQLTKKLISDLNFIFEHVDGKLLPDLKIILEQMGLKPPMDKNGSDFSQNNSQFQHGGSLDRGNQDTEGFMEFLECMKSLNPQLRNCLYSLAVFPEEEELKKRLVVYWWIGLGLIPLRENSSRTAEELGEIFFSDLVDKGVLMPVIREHNQAVDRCTIKPIIHRQLRSACEKKGLLKSNEIIKNSEEMKEGTLLTYGGENSNLKALLNLYKKYLNSKDIINKNDVQVVQLGKWLYTKPEVNNMVEETSSGEIKSKDHIEVDEIEFLQKLGNKVTYLSLGGVSRIEELHESIGKLENLMILDLRACHNLEKLPQKPRSKLHQKFIRLPLSQESWFKKLTHLDISECYLLDHMPKWVCELSNLEVLKGFVVGSGENKSQSCRLQDLSKLKKIRKLSIRIATSSFKTEDFIGIKQLDRLKVLTITWGGEANEGNKEPKTNGAREGEAREGKKEPEIPEVKGGDTTEVSKEPQKAEETGDHKEESGKVEVSRSNKDSVKAKPSDGNKESKIVKSSGGNKDSRKDGVSEGNKDILKSEESEGNKEPEIVEVRGTEDSQGNKEPEIVEVRGVEASEGSKEPDRAERRERKKDSRTVQISEGNKEAGKAKRTRSINDSGKVSKDDKKQTDYFPKNLEKLDIRCYPEANLLNAELKNLKRLYIRGGMIKELTNEHNWPVETLRLRFLNELQIDWDKFLKSFNNLKCVEYKNCPGAVDCTKLENFPKDTSCWRPKNDGLSRSSPTVEISNQS